jgi:leucyl/phenylalanyl-tRNA---protein transferase
MAWTYGMTTEARRDATEPASQRAADGVSQRLQRWLLGLLWSLKPPRLWGVPATLVMLARHYAGLGPGGDVLPDPETVLRHPDGLAGICTDLSVPVLKAAYASGLFPFAHIGPQKWWAPGERMVCVPAEVHISKNVRRLLRIKQFEVTFDTDFDAIIEACARPRPGRPHLTWIRPDIMQAYEALHDAGLAHSVEVWDRAGNLAGGLYGVAIGKAFFTESMFARQPDASKVGFVTLSYYLQHWGFVLNDAKRDSSHLRRLGFRPIPRREFNAMLARACSEPGPEGSWKTDDLDVSQWHPERGVANAD